MGRIALIIPILILAFQIYEPVLIVKVPEAPESSPLELAVWADRDYYYWSEDNFRDFRAPYAGYIYIYANRKVNITIVEEGEGWRSESHGVYSLPQAGLYFYRFSTESYMVGEKSGYVTLKFEASDDYGNTASAETIIDIRPTTPDPYKPRLRCKSYVPNLIAKDVDSELKITIINCGGGAAANVKAKIVETSQVNVVSGVATIDRLEPGEEWVVTFKVKSTVEGPVPVEVELTYSSAGQGVKDNLRVVVFSGVVKGRIVEVNMPEKVKVGEQFDVEVRFKNTGSIETTYIVTFKSGVEEKRASRVLGPGESATHTFTVVFHEPGEKLVAIELLSGESQLDKKSASITVEESRCIIVTAAYGSELMPGVVFLKDFRDRKIRSTYLGERFLWAFEKLYYTFSPQLATFISRHETLRVCVRIGLKPLIEILKLSSMAYSFGDLSVLIMGLAASLAIGVVYLWPLSFILRLRTSAILPAWLASAVAMLVSWLFKVDLIASLASLQWVALTILLGSLLAGETIKRIPKIL